MVAIPDSVFEDFPVLTTNRLRLRQVRSEDSADIFSFKSDPLVTAPYCSEEYTDIEQANKWIRSLFDGYAKRQALMWMITLRDENRPIGDICLWNLDIESECGELGYELHRNYWKRGIASEAAEVVIRYGFTVMKLNRIEADPFKRNEPSSLLLERLGFKLEGNLRKRLLFRREFYDQLYYGLLREEWLGSKT